MKSTISIQRPKPFGLRSRANSELKTRLDKEHQRVICSLTKLVMMQPGVDASQEAEVVSDLNGIDKSQLLCDRNTIATAISMHAKEDVLPVFPISCS